MLDSSHVYLHLVGLVHEILTGMQVEAGLLVAVVDVHPRLQMGDVLVIVAVSNTQCSVCIKGSCTSFVKETLPVRHRETGHGSQE